MELMIPFERNVSPAKALLMNWFMQEPATARALCDAMKKVNYNVFEKLTKRAVDRNINVTDNSVRSSTNSDNNSINNNSSSSTSSSGSSRTDSRSLGVEDDHIITYTDGSSSSSSSGSSLRSIVSDFSQLHLSLLPLKIIAMELHKIDKDIGNLLATVYTIKEKTTFEMILQKLVEKKVTIWRNHGTTVVN